MRKAGVEHPEAAIGAVDVEPEALLLAEVGEITERVDGTGLHAPGVRRDQERTVAGPAVSCHRRSQVGQIHPEVLADLNLARSSEPEREGSLLQAGMPLRRHVHGEPGMPGQAFGPDVPAVDLSAPVPRNFQAMPVRVRSPAEEHPVAPVLGESDELHKPANDRALHVDSRIITAGAARVGNR